MTANPLAAHPLEKLLELRIFQKGRRLTEMLKQFHLVVARVNTTVALPANIDAAIKLFTTEVFLEAGSAVQLLRNQVMKG